MRNFNYILSARRKEDELVTVGLTIENISNIEKYKQLTCEVIETGLFCGVVFHISDGSDDYMRSGGNNKIQFSCDFKIDIKYNTIRVFYFNDNLDDSILEYKFCFINFLNKYKLDINAPEFFDCVKKTEEEIDKRPRQSGNGGVVSIIED